MKHLENRPTWDELWMSFAYLMSLRSHDPNTAVGAVFVRDNRVLSVGYNGVPSGVTPCDFMMEKPAKYEWMAHGESNAIANAAREGVSLRGSTVYVPILPCTPCARQMIQVGVRRVVVHKEGCEMYAEGNNNSEWQKGWDVLEDMFSRAYSLLDVTNSYLTQPTLEIKSMPDLPIPIMRLSDQRRRVGDRTP